MRQASQAAVCLLLVGVSACGESSEGTALADLYVHEIDLRGNLTGARHVTLLDFRDPRGVGCPILRSDIRGSLDGVAFEAFNRGAGCNLGALGWESKDPSPFYDGFPPAVSVIKISDPSAELTMSVKSLFPARPTWISPPEGPIRGQEAVVALDPARGPYRSVSIVIRQSYDLIQSLDRWLRVEAPQIEGNLVRFVVPPDVFTREGFMNFGGGSPAVEVVGCSGATRCVAVNSIVGVLPVFIR